MSDPTVTPESHLQGVVEMIGASATARLLDVKEPALTKMLCGAAAVSPEVAARAEALEAVLARALLVFEPAVAVDWLEGTEPTLGFARPIQVLFLQGAPSLFGILERIGSGGYA